MGILAVDQECKVPFSVRSLYVQRPLGHPSAQASMRPRRWARGARRARARSAKVRVPAPSSGLWDARQTACGSRAGLDQRIPEFRWLTRCATACCAWQRSARGLQGCAGAAGVYAIVQNKGDRDTHLEYRLEVPEEPGPVQKELRIGKEGNILVSIKSAPLPLPAHAAAAFLSPVDWTKPDTSCGPADASPGAAHVTV